MNNEERYRSTLGGMTPSPAWQARTLAAMKQAQGQKRPSPKPLAIAATAAALALAVTGGVWLSGRMGADPDGPGVARTPEPVVTPTPSAPQAWNESFSIVTDPSQLMGKNPTAGRLDELTELKVYEEPSLTDDTLQRTLADALALEYGLTITDYQWDSLEDYHIPRPPTLTAQCADGSQIRLDGLGTQTVLFDPARQEEFEARLTHKLTAVSHATLAQEQLESYTFAGERYTSLQTFFVDDPTQPLSEQLYNYTFRRFSAQEGIVSQNTYPSVKGTYPLRSESDALASFRSGDYWGSHCTAHPDQAEILQVTIEYDFSAYPYIQPVYRILFTQDYWDEVIADWMHDGVDPSPFMGVGIAYVPAIDPKYQDEIPYYRLFNDAPAHHTPEDLN